VTPARPSDYLPPPNRYRRARGERGEGGKISDSKTPFWSLLARGGGVAYSQSASRIVIKKLSAVGVRHRRVQAAAEAPLCTRSDPRSATGDQWTDGVAVTLPLTCIEYGRHSGIDPRYGA
jgi:hypothetical protein